jgi:hypothetical protein
MHSQISGHALVLFFDDIRQPAFVVFLYLGCKLIQVDRPIPFYALLRE